MQLSELSEVSKTKVEVINNCLNQRKAAGYDLMTAKILKEVPNEGLELTTFIFNAVFRLQYFPVQLKVAQVIVIQQPGKPAHEETSYEFVTYSVKAVGNNYSKKIEPNH